MREPCHSKRIILTIFLSFLFCLLAYQAIAVFGVLTFADLLDSDLMLNYDASKPLVMIGIAAIVFKTVTTYPLILFPARLAIDDTIVKLFHIQFPERSELQRRVVIVSVWFLSTLVLAIFVPDISSTISMMGSLAVIFTLIIPGLLPIPGWGVMHDNDDENFVIVYPQSPG
jgi:sodium-coupled neutral amino acid transporter 7/8